MLTSPPQPPAIVLSIPAIGVRTVVRLGTGEAVLARGPGFYSGTGRPGCGCTIAIAGHRVTPVPGFDGHGPFRNLDRVRRGSVITLGTARYRVTGFRTVRPGDTSALAEVGHERLVLTTCTPPGSDTFRLEL